MLTSQLKNLLKFKDRAIKDNSMFTVLRKGTPVHVKAAWIYNDLLKHFKLNNYEKIIFVGVNFSGYVGSLFSRGFKRL